MLTCLISTHAEVEFKNLYPGKIKTGVLVIKDEARWIHMRTCIQMVNCIRYMAG
jgi:hypothetical protein